MSTMSAGRASRPDTLPVLPSGGASMKRSHSLSGLEEAPKRIIVRHTRHVLTGSAADMPRPSLLSFICSGDSQRRASCSAQPAATTTNILRRRSSATMTSTESLNALMDPTRRRRDRRGSSVESTASNCSVRSVTGRSVKTPIGTAASPAMKHRAIKPPGSETAASGAASAAAASSPCATASAMAPPVGVGASHHRINLRGGPRMPTGFMDRMVYDIPHHLEELERQLGLTSSMSSVSTMSTLDVDSADLNATRLELEMELEDELLTPNDSFEELLTDAELSHVSHAITRETPKISASDKELDIRYQRLVAWASEAAKSERPKPPPVIEPEIGMEMIATANAGPGMAKKKAAQSVVDEPEILAEISLTAMACPALRRREVSPPVVPLIEPEAVAEFEIVPLEIPEAKIAPPIVAEQEIIAPEAIPPPYSESNISPLPVNQDVTQRQLSQLGTTEQERFQQEVNKHEISQSDVTISDILPPKASQHELSRQEIYEEEISPLTEPDISRPDEFDRGMSPPEVTEISEDQENWNRVDTKLKTDPTFETIPMLEDTYFRESHLETTPIGDAYSHNNSAYAMETVAMETEREPGGVLEVGETPGGSRAAREEGMAVGESDVGVSEEGWATTGISPAACLPPPPPPPPTPTPPPGEACSTPPLSSTTGSITTISTTGLIETEFSDPQEEVPVHVEVIPEEEEDEPYATPIGRDRAATPPGGEFYNYGEQYHSLPSYYPSENSIDPSQSLVADSMYDAAYSEYRPVGESTYMGESLDEDQYRLQEPEPLFTGEEEVGGYRSSSPAYTEQAGLRLLQEEQQGSAMEEEAYSTLEERLSHLEEQESSLHVNSHLPPLTGRVEEEGYGAPTSPPAAHPAPGGSARVTHDIPTDTNNTLTEETEVKVAAPEKTKLKGILKKTSSFDVKEPDKKTKAVEAHDVLRGSEVDIHPTMVRDSETQPPRDVPGGKLPTPGDTTYTGESEMQGTQTDKPEMEQLRRRVSADAADVTTATTSFPSLSDVMHAKSYDPGTLDVRTRLTLLDAVINFLLLTPLTVLFYHATCRLLQMSFLRMLPLLGPWFILLLGGSIEFIASFCQRSVVARAPKPEVGRPPFADVNLPFLLAAKSFNFVLGFGNVCHMVAMSSLVDLYVGNGFGVGLRVALTSLVVLWTLRCGRNVVAAPLYVGVDADDPGVFASTTMFRVEPDMSAESAADILGTIAVMTSFVHLHWAGVWNCADAVLFPSYFALSMMTSVLLGSAICLLFLLLQRPAGEISRNLERQKKEPLRIAFENAFNTTANIGVVLLWRGLWMVYDVMADYFPIYCRSWDITPLAACALSFLLLALAHCSSSLLFKGCEVDGELRGGAGVSFTTGYFTEILQGHWDTEPDESGSTIKPTPEKPAAASSAIPSQVLKVTNETPTAKEQPNLSPNGSTPTLKQKFA